MAFSGSTYNLEMLDGRYVYGGVATSMPKVHDQRIATEFQGIATGLTALAWGGVTSGQIAFPATQNPSADANTLDDYEEGTWTPTLTFTTPGDLSVTYTLRNALYTKIGRYVMAQCEVQSATFTHTTAASTLLITGLPFAVANVRTTGPIRWSGINAAGSTDLCCTSSAASANVSFLGMAMGAGQVAIDATHCPTGGTMVLIFGFPYSV